MGGNDGFPHIGIHGRGLIQGRATEGIKRRKKTANDLQHRQNKKGVKSSTMSFAFSTFTIAALKFAPSRQER